MADAIKRDEAGNIANKLNVCKNNLQKGNIFSCLVAFREVLEKMTSIKMIPADEKSLHNEINIFQKKLASSNIFRDVYGPVTFRDNDIAPALALMQQLIEIKEEEVKELLAVKEETQAISDGTSADADGINAQVKQIKILIEQGDYATAQEMLVNREELTSILVDDYNGAGIEHRRAGRYDEALSEFKKILIVNPQDEGLYYNMARVYIAKKEWKTAEKTINEGLKISPEFGEGIKLLKYIRENGLVNETSDKRP
jgi:tetratricopeptide (TPR) repeat protein